MWDFTIKYICIGCTIIVFNSNLNNNVPPIFSVKVVYNIIVFNYKNFNFKVISVYENLLGFVLLTNIFKVKYYVL